MMILANNLVAEKITASAKSKALLRKQDPFPIDALEDLKTYIAVNKLDIDLSSTMTLQRSLDVLQAKDEKMHQCVTRKLMTKLKAAAYICVGENSLENCAHYALGLKLYTHFTSPIRRYADLVVHRLLETIIANDGRPLYDCSLFADGISDKYKNGKNAGRAHERLFYSFLLRDQGMMKCKALVYDVEEKRVGIYIPTIDFDKGISMGEQKQLGITRFDFNKETRSMRLVFKKDEEGKKKRSNNGKIGAIKYVPVKKALEEVDELLKAKDLVPDEVVVKAFDTIYVGLYVDTHPPMELKFKILKQ